MLTWAKDKQKPMICAWELLIPSFMKGLANFKYL